MGRIETNPHEKKNWLLPSTNMAVRCNPTSDHGTYKKGTVHQGLIELSIIRAHWYSISNTYIEPKKWEKWKLFHAGKVLPW